MGIESEMIARFNAVKNREISHSEDFLSNELDKFFDNVLDTVVDYFGIESTKI